MCYTASHSGATSSTEGIRAKSIESQKLQVSSKNRSKIFIRDEHEPRIRLFQEMSAIISLLKLDLYASFHHDLRYKNSKYLESLLSC